jgi:hypothetical protein
MFPGIRIIMADAGYQSRKLALQLLHQDGCKLVIVKRKRRAFKITGLTWIVERSFAWLGRNRRFSKDGSVATAFSPLIRFGLHETQATGAVQRATLRSRNRRPVCPLVFAVSA